MYLIIHIKWEITEIFINRTLLNKLWLFHDILLWSCSKNNLCHLLLLRDIDSIVKNQFIKSKSVYKIPFCNCILLQLQVIFNFSLKIQSSSSIGKESACNAGDTGLIPGSGRSPGEGIGYPGQYSWVCLLVQLVKNLPVMWETWVPSLGWEDLLEKGMATHSSILAWRIPWTV